MKKGRFLWSAHRITEKQKAGKARNIKEKQKLEKNDALHFFDLEKALDALFLIWQNDQRKKLCE